MKARSSNPALSLDNSVHQVAIRIRWELREELRRGVPFAYLTNFSDFYENRFFVNEAVLIPRPETEFLVDLILRPGKKYSSIYDLGTGSGVILLSLLAKLPHACGTGADISPEALEVAKINSHRLRLSDRCNFSQTDRFEGIAEKKFDLIVSNPPYIKRDAHRSGVHTMVHEHEPALALYLSDDIYEAWFTQLFTGAFKALVPGGVFFMEGHESEVAQQVPLLKAAGFSDPVVLPDLLGRDRFLRAHRMI